MTFGSIAAGDALKIGGNTFTVATVDSLQGLTLTGSAVTLSIATLSDGPIERQTFPEPFPATIAGPPGPALSGPANAVAATPDGASGVMTLRRLVPGDLPPIVSPYTAASLASAWALRPTPNSSGWGNISYSPELRRVVIVSDATGAYAHVMTSDDDGQTWIARTTPGDSYEWNASMWVDTLQEFVALPHSASYAGYMTSPDGIDWTLHPNSVLSGGFFDSMAISPQLGIVCAVQAAATGAGNPMAVRSSDLSTWTASDGSSPGGSDITWADALGLFVSVRNNLNYVSTSADCNHWTAQAPIATTSSISTWGRVEWAPQIGKLLVTSTKGDGTDQRTATSTEAVHWTAHASTNDSVWWLAMAWSQQLGLFSAVSSTTTDTMYSFDGDSWLPGATAAPSTGWRRELWIPEYGEFLASNAAGATQQVMTSNPIGPTAFAPQQTASGGGGGVSQPSNQIVVGTGTSVSSSPNATCDLSGNCAFAGSLTFGGYLAGLLHSDGSGHITSSSIGLNSGDVTGVLQPANGGTGFSTCPSGGFCVSLPNDPTTGTVLNEEVDIGNNGNATVYPLWSSGHSTPVGICVANCGTTGNAVVQVAGIAQVQVDSTAHIGALVVPSVTTIGAMTSSGLGTTNRMTAGTPIVGRIMDTNTAAGLHPIELMLSPIYISGIRVPGPLASIPSTCAQGSLYFATDAPSGQNLKLCVTTNTWAAVSLPRSQLTGVPSTFTPSAHATTHQSGGSDPIATSTPAANAIPQAGAGGTLAATWLPLATGLADGYLSHTDWSTFSGKQNALGFTPLNPANNLADIGNAAAARGNLGLGGAATENVGSTTGTVAAGDDSRFTAVIPRSRGGLNSATPGTGFIRDGTTPVAGELSGDCTTSGSFATSCGKTGGVPFAPSATQDATNAANIGSGTLPDARLSANVKRRAIGYTFDGNGTALTSGVTKYLTVPFACTITAWNVAVDTGTATLKVWKVATGAAIPTVANSISTSGVSIASGTAVHSTTVTDFTTTAVSANDVFGFNLFAVSGATFVNFILECDQ